MARVSVAWVVAASGRERCLSDAEELVLEELDALVMTGRRDS